ncbi:acyl-CoA N-acyltransferase [Clavulina sp. PMI_390]|nr:acyl-CoA N-acyltransferase [Clavulina sp. PMI_390]
MEQPNDGTHITYRNYESDADLPAVTTLVGSELSEPYVIYTYKYFLMNWSVPSLTPSTQAEPAKPVGVIVCKQDIHKSKVNRGYIAMLSVDKQWRKRGIARNLVQRSIDQMMANGAREVVLETEYDNVAALAFYAAMGFMREKRLFRFYMNGKDAFRSVNSL